MHILISPNAFKNCLDANAAAMAILQGLQESKLSFTYQLLPVGDGGDGTGALIVQQCGGSMVTAMVKDPLMRDIQTSFGWMEDRQTAVIEMAAASGLHCLAANELDPLHASSFGTGELIRKALDKGAGHIILCLGGSATVDGGTGMLRALGVRFLDMDGLELTDLPIHLKDLAVVDTSGLDPRIAACKISVLCDVKNPLLGDTGAAAVFAPQKGATKEAVTLLETALTALNKVCIHQLGKDLNSLQYGGTAGGAAAGLHAFLDAQLLNGIDYYLELTGFEKALQHCTLVITGEGGIDTQTLQGTANEAIDHTTGYPCVTADNDLVFSCFANSPGTIGRSKFYDIKRCKSLSCRTTDSAAYAGYRFDECQSVAILAHKIINNWLANAQNRSPTVHDGTITFDNRKSAAIVLSVQLT